MWLLYSLKDAKFGAISCACNKITHRVSGFWVQFRGTTVMMLLDFRLAKDDPKLERRRGVDERLARLIQTTYLNSVELWCHKFSGLGTVELKS